MTSILQLPAWLGAILAMLAAVAASALPLAIVRRRLRDEMSPSAREVAETVAVRIGTIHALILALVFADAQSTYTNLQRDVSQEIATIEHLAMQIDQWNGPEANLLRSDLALYVGAVMQHEWHAGARPHGSKEAAQAFHELDMSILDLTADTPRQQSLRTRMITNADDLQDHRKARLSLLHRGLSSLFWWMALTGFGIIAGFFLVFPATPVHIAILSVYGAYTGLALYFILALSHPYAGPAAIDTTPYQVLLDEEIKAPRVTSTP
ncbi:DUF4239 domain-containing protein [Microvirga guangxiensis]|uniref:DUF4239 domain-containing protein n=1 Tax=Microvirga guangxiensis TaxID=549386 RepID=A0A1G5B115_9HYPH|nr:DUF4239 domain-containing protein [Microvirga guangxiensis]SCX83746.1 Protein of unknown function [Microvirga guangxiensis]